MYEIKFIRYEIQIRKTKLFKNSANIKPLETVITKNSVMHSLISYNVQEFVYFVTKNFAEISMRLTKSKAGISVMFPA